jgi:hypothetical protein
MGSNSSVDRVDRDDGVIIGGLHVGNGCLHAGLHDGAVIGSIVGAREPCSFSFVGLLHGDSDLGLVEAAGLDQGVLADLGLVEAAGLHGVAESRTSGSGELLLAL